MVLPVLDAARLDRLIDLVIGADPLTIAAQVVPDVAHLLTPRSSFVHAALLVFPDDERDLVSALAGRGFRCSLPVPSTIVRDRLRIRNGLTEAPPVHIVHAHTTLADRTIRELEIFVAPSELTEAAARERVSETESHLAFAADPTTDRVRELCDVLSGDGMVRDGGGYNPHENTTTLYFRRPRPTGYLYRIELLCSGWYPETLADHLDEQPLAAETA